jgi:hypothetical protein
LTCWTRRSTGCSDDHRCFRDHTTRRGQPRHPGAAVLSVLGVRCAHRGPRVPIPRAFRSTIRSGPCSWLSCCPGCRTVSTCVSGPSTCAPGIGPTACRGWPRAGRDAVGSRRSGPHPIRR